MNDLQIFNNEEFGSVRTTEINGEILFVGKDVAEALGYKDTSDALKRHVDEEDKLTRCFTDSGQSREMYVINESGLYSLVLSSKLPNAKKFKRWVTSEVLPSIRRTGQYQIPTTTAVETNYKRSLSNIDDSDKGVSQIDTPGGKQAMSLACIILADRIATETIFKDDTCISIDEAKELLIDRTELSEGERCYNYLSDIIAMNSSRFDATQNIEKWGFIKDEYVCFYPHAFNKRCEEGNFSKQSFMSWAKKKQIILADKNRNTKVFKINGKPIRAIAIKLNGTISINDDGFLEIDSTSDLPLVKSYRVTEVT